MRSSSERERRRHRRLNLAFPIRFSGRTTTGSSLQGRGLTVDISSGGLRFETEVVDEVAPQTELTLYITIPRRPEGGDSTVFLSGRATVLRCESLSPACRHHTGARWSVAARFHKHPDISLPILEDFSLGAN